jgi:hypothetical protein
MKTHILDALLVMTLGLVIWQNFHLRAQLIDDAGEIQRLYDEKSAYEHQLSICQQGLDPWLQDNQGK